MRAVKLLTGVVGIIAVAAAVPMLIAGTALFAWAAGGDETQLPTVFVSETGTAIAGDFDLMLEDHKPFVRVPFADVHLEATDSTQSIFLGIGDRYQVDTFLRTGGVPGAQEFWVVADEGREVAIDWDPPSGDWTAVIMNADGSAGVDATISASLLAAPIRVAGGLLALAGFAVGAIGVVLVVSGWGNRSTPSRGPQAVPAGS